MMSCLLQTNVWISDPPRGLTSKSWPLCNHQIALTSCLSPKQPRYFQGQISTGVFWAADVPLHPSTHHRECLSDRGAAHQNHIRALLATRRTHAQNASCGGRSVPFSSSFLPLYFTVSLCPPNTPSLKQTKQVFNDFFVCLFVCFVLTK